MPQWESQDKVGKHKLPAGKALPITKARLTVGEFSGEKPVGATDIGIRFDAKLKAGETMLKGSFLDGEMMELAGAYYATVRRK